MKKLIVFLVRKRLGLKKYERFQFANQKSKKACYYFSEDSIIKIKPYKGYEDSWSEVELSGVSLNWLLSDECEIRKVNGV